MKIIIWLKKTFTLFNLVRLLWVTIIGCGFVYGHFWFYDLFKPFISNGFLRFLAIIPVMGIIAALITVPSLEILEKFFPNEMKGEKKEKTW